MRRKLRSGHPAETDPKQRQPSCLVYTAGFDRVCLKVERH
jgi:hypothetical protein